MTKDDVADALDALLVEVVPGAGIELECGHPDGGTDRD